jgi:hypothetical protein
MVEAAHWLGQARDGWSEIDDRAGLAVGMNQNSRLLFATENILAALEQAEKGLALAQRSENRDREIRMLNSLGVFAFNEGDCAALQGLALVTHTQDHCDRNWRHRVPAPEAQWRNVCRVRQAGCTLIAHRNCCSIRHPVRFQPDGHAGRAVRASHAPRQVAHAARG